MGFGPRGAPEGARPEEFLPLTGRLWATGSRSPDAGCQGPRAGGLGVARRSLLMGLNPNPRQERELECGGQLGFGLGPASPGPFPAGQPGSWRWPLVSQKAVIVEGVRVLESVGALSLPRLRYRLRGSGGKAAKVIPGELMDLGLVGWRAGQRLVGSQRLPKTC